MRRLIALLAAHILLCATVNAKVEITPERGVTVAGIVTCQGKPLEGVTVSDGALFTQTDSNGVYQLRSLKYYGSVFVITPSGYEPTTKRGILPQFWAPLNDKKLQKFERHDFELRQVDNSRHRIIFTADMHFAGRNEDMLQFKRHCMPALKQAAAVKDSIPVYSITLGDMCRNDAWYSQDIEPSDALSILATMRYPSMIYSVMGENEYDGAVPSGPLTDHHASQLYATSCAPRFYSFNAGEVHYVVLDNTHFLNNPGDGKYPTEIVGKRDFERRVSADCLAWLRRDLEFVKDKTTPIVVCMHHNVIRTSNKGGIIKALTKAEDTDSLIACFKEFPKVHFVTGHSHRRRVSAPKDLKNIIEHNVTSISGNNWETGFNDFVHLSSDGSAAGFEIFDVDGRKISWQYRSAQQGERTFSAYDMNSVKKFYNENEEVKNMLRAYPQKRVNYGASGFENYVYINYWADEPGSKLEAWEGDKPLKLKRIQQDDPLYTQATIVIRHRNARGRKLNVGRNTSQHLFRAKTDSTNTVVKIRTTDPFGRTFIDSLVRPAPFIVSKRSRR